MAVDLAKSDDIASKEKQNQTKPNQNKTRSFWQGEKLFPPKPSEG